MGDAPWPCTASIESHGFVQQKRLREILVRADVLVLPSRQDGFGMVLCQALACGVPLVCTDRTGGEDLAEFLEDPSWVTVVKPGDAAALRAGIHQALAKAGSQTGLRDILASRRERLSWRAYGQRYDAELRRRMVNG
jgi:glycosyltransferase involved in cell wall biosynthesis